MADDALRADAERFLEGEGSALDGPLTARLEAHALKVATRDRRTRQLGLDPRDVAQDALVKVYTKPPTNRQSGDPLAVLLSWVGVVTVNHIESIRRRRRREAPMPDSWSPMDRGTANPEKLKATEQAVAWAMANLLTPTEARVLEIMLTEPELSSKELASRYEARFGEEEATPMSPQAVDTYRCRIRRALRPLLVAAADEAEGGEA